MLRSPTTPSHPHTLTLERFPTGQVLTEPLVEVFAETHVLEHALKLAGVLEPAGLLRLGEGEKEGEESRSQPCPHQRTLEGLPSALRSCLLLHHLMQSSAGQAS